MKDKMWIIQIEEVKEVLAKSVPPPPPVSTTSQEIDGTNDLEGEAVECKNNLIMKKTLQMMLD